MWKPEKRGPKKQRPISKAGKVARARADDKRRKLKAEPGRHDGKRFCYICEEWHLDIDLEHVIDASERPDLRHEPKNHKWACTLCNINKKLRRLKPGPQARVDAAREEVLSATLS